MAAAGSGKSRERRSAAAEAERLAAEKEAAEDRVFALTHRVATLEGRERDLNELIIGHRERIAALQAERDALGKELENGQREIGALRDREGEFTERLSELRERSAALEAEREAIGKELDEEKQRSGQFERRTGALDEQLAGARDRIAALEGSREELNDEVKSANQRTSELRARETDLTEQIGAHEDRIAALDSELDEERQRASEREFKNRELSLELGRRSERVAALEAGQEALRDELDTARRQITSLHEREREVQDRTVTLHAQVARLEAEGEMLNRTLREERAAHSALQQQEASLQPQLEEARERIRELESQDTEATADVEERERELQERIEAIQEQIGRVKAHRDSLERSLTKEQGNRAKLEQREAELTEARTQMSALEAERDKLAADLGSERETITELRAAEGELQKDLAAAREREGELQAELSETRQSELELRGMIESNRQQVSDLELERANLIAERDGLLIERDRLSNRLDELLSSRTYRMMRFTWRARRRIRHPFRRAPARPALPKPKKARRKQAAELEKPVETPAVSPEETIVEQPKPKPIPTPAMRKPVRAAAERAPQPEQASKPQKVAEAPAPQEPVEPARVAEAPESDQAAEPAKAPERAEPERTSKPAPQPKPVPVAASPAPVPTEEDLERERWLAKAQAPPADVGQLRVAGILDEMSAACFEPDCDLLRIDSETWAEQLEAHEPHLLLVESTWQGNNGSWQYMVASYTHPDYIGLPNLKALIAWCRERDIPTVFWNKEDPVHFERFKEAAALFDYIFTSDANCVDRYAALEREGSGPISSLQFAAQPRVHNPIGAPVERSTSPVFAGAYYRDRHIDRQESLQMLLDAAMPFGLEIYDRRFGNEDKAFGFPERFLDRVKGSLPYDQVIEAYKSHRLFLNVNSVHDSPTMFSRRVFELLACGTAVVSTESVGVEQTLGDVVSMVETPKQATEALTRLQEDDYWRELSQRGRRKVLREHTYRHRLAEVANALGFNVTAYPGEEVAALALVDDVEQARKFRAVVSSISAQETRPAELLIGSHTSVAGDLQELSGDGSNIHVRVLQQDPETTRSQRYRELASLAASPWLAVLHPAHTYGEHHLTDLVLTTRFTDADVIGNASFETTDGSGAIDRSLEHRFVESVHPHSVLVKRELIAGRGWPDDAADDPLSDWFRQGIRIYSGDAGNFRADAALGLPGRAAAAGSEPGPEG
ncbi:MAG TPA: glycosyltransferase [Solirubrobacterales bacterium]